MHAAAILFHHDPGSSDTDLLNSDSIKQAYLMTKYREILFITTTEKPLPVVATHSINGKKEGEAACPCFCKHFGLEELLPP